MMIVMLLFVVMLLKHRELIIHPVYIPPANKQFKILSLSSKSVVPVTNTLLRILLTTGVTAITTLGQKQV